MTIYPSDVKAEKPGDIWDLLYWYKNVGWYSFAL